MASFWENYRNALRNGAFDDYSGQTFDTDELKRDVKGTNFSLRKGIGIGANSVGTAGLSAAAAGIGTGNPIAAVIGGALGVTLGGADAYLRTAHANSLIRKRDEINKELQQEYLKNWTNYKNDKVKQLTGMSVDDYASAGKMIDDDGNIVDIDYDYYATVPEATLERVFGTMGAQAVRKEINNRKSKDSSGEFNSYIQRIDQ